jgi:hypothetical protein
LRLNPNHLNIANKMEKLSNFIRKIWGNAISALKMKEVRRKQKAQWNEVEGAIDSDKSSVEMERNMWKNID